MLHLRLISILVLGLLLCGCDDPQTATRALENMGFTDIHVGGFRAFACSDSDTFTTEFAARNSQGRPVTGVVCNGLMKGATVRFD